MGQRSSTLDGAQILPMGQMGRGPVLGVKEDEIDVQVSDLKQKGHRRGGSQETSLGQPGV